MKVESELKKLKFKELYDLIYGGQLLRFVRKEALRTDTHPSVILMLVIIYRR